MVTWGTNPGMVVEVTDTVLATTSFAGRVARQDATMVSRSINQLAAITSVDGRIIGAGQVGPMTGRLSTLFHTLTETEGVPVASGV